MRLKDSGTRREFSTSAVRDCAEGKGRCDLLPLATIGKMTNDVVLQNIGKYVYTGETSYIEAAIKYFSALRHRSIYDTMLEVAKHYEDGAKKYDERNWEKGIPVHCYVDSGVRHYLKYIKGDFDEPHDRAFFWNMLGLLWTHENKPELIDLPFAEVTKK